MVRIISILRMRQLLLIELSKLPPSFTGAGAPSTIALASFKPRPVASRTTLITLILDAPASSRLRRRNL